MTKLFYALIVLFGLIGCNNASTYTEGKQAYDSGNMDEASSIYAKACKYADFQACFALGGMYHHNEISGGWRKAIDFFQQSCDGSIGEGCYEVAKLYSIKDEKKGLSVFAEGCEMDHAESCYEVAKKNWKGLGTEHDGYIAKDFLKKACDLGHNTACNKLNQLESAGF